MYTLNTGKVGVPTDNLVTFSTQNKTTYNGVEFTMNARGAKYLVFGGVTTDRRAAATCDERDNPNSARFCDSFPPFRTTVKLSGAYTFPYDIQVSGSFASIPGPGVSANYTVTSAIAARPIIGSTAGTASTVVNLVESGAIPRLPEPAGHATRQDVPLDRYKIRVHGRLQCVQRRHGRPRKRTYAASGTNVDDADRPFWTATSRHFGLQMSF
jgi:hypothetical protein